jgi:hypothetical protein
MEDLIPIFSILLGNSPLLTAALVGIVIAALYWPRARRSAVLVLVACVVEMLLIVSSALMTGWYVPHAIRDEGVTGVSHVAAIWGAANGLFQAVVFGLLIWAAFARRGHAPAAPR